MRFEVNTFTFLFLRDCDCRLLCRGYCFVLTSKYCSYLFVLRQTFLDLFDCLDRTSVVTTRISFIRCNTDCHLDFFGGETLRNLLSLCSSDCHFLIHWHVWIVFLNRFCNFLTLLFLSGSKGLFS